MHTNTHHHYLNRLVHEELLEKPGSWTSTQSFLASLLPFIVECMHFRYADVLFRRCVNEVSAVFVQSASRYRVSAD